MLFLLTPILTSTEKIEKDKKKNPPGTCVLVAVLNVGPRLRRIAIRYPHSCRDADLSPLRQVITQTLLDTKFIVGGLIDVTNNEGITVRLMKE